mgnify:CR=1 FL=1
MELLMSYINPRYTQMKEENDAMNSLLIERDEEIEKLKKEVARLKASNKRWYNIYKDLRKLEDRHQKV